MKLILFLSLSCCALADEPPTLMAAPVYTLDGEHSFDGQGDNCLDNDVGSKSDLPMAGSPYTIEAWVMPEEVNKYESFGIVGWGTPRRNEQNGLIFWRGSHSLRNVWWQNDLQANLEAPLSDNTYHHVAATWDGSMHRMFVDFVEVAQKSATGYGPTSKDSFCVGRAWHQDASQARFRGKIKNLKIWKNARSASEMQKPASASESSMQLKVLKETKLYTVHTQRGFLNIHSEPGNPFRSDNVVGKWLDGEVIEVLEGPVDTEYGPWLRTSKGWSIKTYGGFEWLRPASVSESQVSVSPMSPVATDEDQKLVVIQSDLDETTEYKGVLSLSISLSDEGTNPQKRLIAHKGTLQVGLQAYFGFTKVSICKILRTQGFDVRRLRSGSLATEVHFSGIGGSGMLADDSGLQVELQAAFDSTVSRIIIEEVSVEWLSPSPTLEDDSGPQPEMVALIVLAAAVPLICLAAWVLRCLYQKKWKRNCKIQGQIVGAGDTSGTLDTLKIGTLDSQKVGKKDSSDNASESTAADGDNASECAVSSTSSITNSEELGQTSQQVNPDGLGAAMY